MKKILLLCFLTLAFLSNSFAQTNQQSNPASIGISGTDVPSNGPGTLDVVVANTGSDPMVPGTFRVSINIPPLQLMFDDPASYITQNYPDWAVVSFTATQLILVNANGEISPSEDVAFVIKVKASPTATQGATAAISVRAQVAPGRSSQAGNTDASAADDNGTGSVNIIGPLPVKLKSFNAVKENKTSLLTWATTEETNSDKFDIQRNTKATGWITIGSKKSNRESSVERNYDFTDSSPLDGENLYRLKMVDLDGTFAYSSVKSVKFELPGEDLSVYPNPSADFIKLRDAANILAVSITDIKGATVYKTGTLSKDEISVKNLTPGMYSVRIEKKNGVSSVQKLVIARQ